MTVNKYGLSRRIPNGIKRAIRQKSGFGCVICGFAIYQYEHVDPEFIDAHSHNPKKMTLLCGSCHDQVTRGIFSKEKVKDAMKNPKCKEKGFTFGVFDIGNNIPQIQFGDSIVTSDSEVVLLQIKGEDLLKFQSPEFFGGPFLLSASFYDEDENLILKIEKNEWLGDASNWDIETVGQTISIRQRLGEISLEITNIPNDKLIISKINMQFRGYKIVGDNKNFIEINSPIGAKIRTSKCSYNFGNSPFKHIVYRLGDENNDPNSLCVYNIL